MDTLVPRALPGTEGSGSLTWSPDSRYLAYASDRQLKKIDIQGGPPQTLCEVMFRVRSGAWSEDGTILFGGRGSGPLHRVAAAGGSATPVTAEAGGFSSFPSFFPITGTSSTTAVVRSPAFSLVRSMRRPRRDRRMRCCRPITARYSNAPMRLREDACCVVRDTTLMVQPFDVTARTLAGQPVPFVEGIATVNRYIAVSASRTGHWRFEPAGARGQCSELVRSRRQGARHRRFTRRICPVCALPGRHAHHLSRQGSELGRRSRLLDLAKGTNTRFTFSRSATDDHSPIWSPDGQRIAFGTSKGLFQLWRTVRRMPSSSRRPTTRHISTAGRATVGTSSSR